MDKTVKIVGIAVAAGILAFAIFQLANYFYVDSVFNNQFGGHIWDINEQDIEENKDAQQKMKELRAEFNDLNNN